MAVRPALSYVIVTFVPSLPTAGVSHAAALQNDILALVAVVLSDTLAGVVRTASSLGRGAFRTTEVERLVQHDNAGDGVLQIRNELCSRCRVHRGGTTAACRAGSKAGSRFDRKGLSVLHEESQHRDKNRTEEPHLVLSMRSGSCTG
ncbi:hypothetical protein GN244_ATG18059 [Phytophthora infestans]|uniref:Uncharacterized protein n=1 Tax=Phytophthora infestans TaxID=4787 RepID=A0A833S9G7_PHYIN|nr:hypothetical protein GN244_ATG18059 [Phytophthora infestans]